MYEWCQVAPKLSRMPVMTSRVTRLSAVLSREANPTGIARLAAPYYPHPAIVRLSDFKTNEYANLIGGKAYEPAEENPMIGFRGASRYYHERYRAGFALECRAIRRAREEIGLDNVIVMGVHANMCVLGRPFSIRQMVAQGKNVLLMRDMTDTMYNSEMRPFVNHFRGTDLVVEHVEKYWCPTVLSTDLVGGKPFRFADDKR